MMNELRYDHAASTKCYLVVNQPCAIKTPLYKLRQSAGKAQEADYRARVVRVTRKIGGASPLSGLVRWPEVRKGAKRDPG